MTLIIGLTGGIGSGKTVASDHFASLGVPIIDTDIIAREIVQPGEPALVELTEAFGEDILANDGQLNRDALRTIAFANPENKQRLDSITHPLIRLATINKVKQVQFSYCIVVIPLLTKDSAFIELTNRIIVVVANKETKVKRVMQRSQLSREETLAIMQSQISDQARLNIADDVINNDATIDDVHQNVEKLHKSYLAAAKQS